MVFSDRNLDKSKKRLFHDLLNILQESHQSAEQLRQQFMQTKMQGQTMQGQTMQGQTMQGQTMQGQGQVREHVIHQQGVQQQQHQHATMNGHVMQHGRYPNVCVSIYTAFKNRTGLWYRQITKSSNLIKS